MSQPLNTEKNILTFLLFLSPGDVIVEPGDFVSEILLLKGFLSTSGSGVTTSLRLDFDFSFVG